MQQLVQSVHEYVTDQIREVCVCVCNSFDQQPCNSLVLKRVVDHLIHALIGCSAVDRCQPVEIEFKCRLSTLLATKKDDSAYQFCKCFLY